MYEQERMQMVNEQIVARGITTSTLLTAIRIVPRELFILEEDRNRAYEDTPLSLGHGQIISPPYLVAKMLDLVEPSPKKTLLVISSGSGYLVAVASFLFKEIVAIEGSSQLIERSKKSLDTLCISRVEIFSEEGLKKISSKKFDSIIVSAALPNVPESLLDMLASKGRLVVPIHDKKSLELVCMVREGDKEKFSKVPVSCSKLEG